MLLAAVPLALIGGDYWIYLQDQIKGAPAAVATLESRRDDVVALLALAIVAQAILLYSFFSMLRVSLYDVDQVVDAVAAGRKAPAVTGRSAITSQTVQALRSLERGVSRTGSRSVGATDELRHASSELEDMARGTVDSLMAQADSVSRIAAAIEQMSASIAAAAENVVETRVAAERSQDASANGERVVRHLTAEIETINASVGQVGETVASLGALSGQIGSIVETIQTVADQTNLLALNAAIEAARAGEHGRGFAVVADEVRGLAVRTRESTHEIKDIVARIQSEVQAMVVAVDGVRRSVAGGMDYSGQACSVLAEIGAQVDLTGERIRAISAAFDEQRQAVSEVSDNVEKLNTNAQVHGLGAKDVAAVAQHLARLAEQLRAVWVRGASEGARS